jgi:branched-chain amino acid transport system permease protein
MAFFLQLSLDGVSLGFLYGISAIGFVLIYRSCGLMNFAHGGIMGFGAFLFFALSVWADWPVILSFLVTLAGSFALGLTLERCFIRPMISRRNLIHNIMITLGLALMLKGFLAFIPIGGAHGIPPFISNIFSFDWHQVHVTSVHISAVTAGIGLLLLNGYFFRFSSQGLSMRAFAGNQLAARAMGVRAKGVFALSWGIAALLCAISAVVLTMIGGLQAGSLSAAGLKIFPVIVLGGLNSVGGAMLGGIGIGLIETFTGGYFSQSLQDLAPYMALLLVLVFKPTGFFGRKGLEKV